MGWLSKPFAQSQWGIVRSKPSAACSLITARPGVTSSASSTEAVVNLLPAWAIAL